MDTKLISLRIVPLCACVLMLGACGTRVVERQVIREQPIVQQTPAQPTEHWGQTA